jgi:hypothetical protein
MEVELDAGPVVLAPAAVEVGNRGKAVDHDSLVPEIPSALLLLLPALAPVLAGAPDAAAAVLTSVVGVADVDAADEAEAEAEAEAAVDAVLPVCANPINRGGPGRAGAFGEDVADPAGTPTTTGVGVMIVPTIDSVEIIRPAAPALVGLLIIPAPVVALPVPVAAAVLRGLMRVGAPKCIVFGLIPAGCNGNGLLCAGGLPNVVPVVAAVDGDEPAEPINGPAGIK